MGFHSRDSLVSSMYPVPPWKTMIHQEIEFLCFSVLFFIFEKFHAKNKDGSNLKTVKQTNQSHRTEDILGSAMCLPTSKWEANCSFNFQHNRNQENTNSFHLQKLSSSEPITYFSFEGSFLRTSGAIQ